MYSTAEQIQLACGILVCTDTDTFIYCCTKCQCEFPTGAELEQHIVFDHHDQKKDVDGIFVDDGIILETTTAIHTTTNISPIGAAANSSASASAATESSDQAINGATKSTVAAGISPNGRLQCEMCPDQSFASLKSIRSHMQRHVTNRLSKQCTICLVRPRNLEKHMKYTHTEAKPYKCDFCDARFKYNMARVMHWMRQNCQFQKCY